MDDILFNAFLQIYYCDKDTWEQIIKDGFDENFPSDDVRVFKTFKSHLYAGTAPFRDLIIK